MKGFSLKQIVAGVFLLALVGLVALRIVQATAEVAPTPDVDQIRAESGIPVEVVAAELAPLEVRRSFTGALRGVRSATLVARTADEILEIPVRVGQRVGEGTVLVRQSAQGSMAAVNQAQAAYEQAQRTAERLGPLHERGAISDQDWDGAQTALRVAQANLDAARRAVVLTSPISGVVTDVMVTAGSFPKSGDPLVRVSDLSRVQVLLGLSPEQAAELARGQQAHLPAQGLEGEVTRIALQADPDTRLVEVELTFPGSASVTPGTLVQADVVVGSKEQALVVPRAALQDGGVWVVGDGDRVQLRTVQLGLQGSDRVEILSGLQADERVVVAGASLLSEGALARVVEG
ncbi:MAG TPA: efflux RND transporter periplasmic adaptor subunit [Longimicrobiales bacterium]|nr:efflux RND transporter periplasmic adaptor subunit [Longimicrobiales bacterium]